MVCQLHCIRQEISPKNNQHSPKNHWLPTSLPGNHCPLPLYLQGQKHCEGHPGHHLYNLLPSGRRYRSLRARTTRLQNSNHQDFKYTNMKVCNIVFITKISYMVLHKNHVQYICAKIYTTVQYYYLYIIPVYLQYV